MSWNEPELKEEKFAGVEVGAGNVKSESVDVVSEEAEVSSSRSSLAMNPEAELELAEAHKIIFSSENWPDMLYIILKHTRSHLVLVELDK